MTVVRRAPTAVRTAMGDPRRLRLPPLLESLRPRRCVDERAHSGTIRIGDFETLREELFLYVH
jgi:hypothetical protein